MGFYPDIGGGGDDNDGGWIAGCLRLSGGNLKYWWKARILGVQGTTAIGDVKHKKVLCKSHEDRCCLKKLKQNCDLS